MNVLSLFDGMSCGLVALKRAGVKVDNYFASEIDKYAIKIAMKNHPEIQQLGDINNYESWDLPKIDLIIGGPPCQGFSTAGKRLNWNDPRSLLFFKAIELVWDLKPKHFLIENVARMNKEIKKELSELLDVKPLEINSALVSAHHRPRVYWTKITNKQPDNKGILLKHIVGHENYLKVKKNGKIKTIQDKANCLMGGGHSGGNHSDMDLIFEYGIEKGRRLFDGKNLSRNFRQGYRVYSEDGKAACLTAHPVGGMGGATGLYNIDGTIRRLTVNECERLQTLPDNYTGGVSNTQRYKMIGNGWTVDVIAHIFRSMIK
jgi:DNA (cytosine-5)-methyltransferase 3A